MHFHALRIVQPSGRVVYSFATTAEAILQLTEIPRIGRNSENQLVGYQRPEISTHIAEIRRYLESSDAVLPNTVVVAFSDEVTFEPKGEADCAQFGILMIPDEEVRSRRIGFVVDGQQRLAAIASCEHSQFPFFVTAFITPGITEQRKQFVLINRTKPLPQGMIFELLPEIEGCLPQHLMRQRQAAAITMRLNLDPASSLYRKIKTPTCPLGTVKDNSIRRAILNSMGDGALFDIARSKSPERALDALVSFVSIYWKGVNQVFPEAWELPPTKSRLTHGVGIVALGYMMDHIYARKKPEQAWTVEFVKECLEVIRPYCAWTEGTWQFGKAEERPWNALQNTDRDVRVLANYLQRLFDSQYSSASHVSEKLR